MVCGTFCQLFNIANRFLWYFSNLETSIRNRFPGGARYPLLPAQLYSGHIVHVQEKEMSSIYMAIMVQALQMKWCLLGEF